MEDKLLRFEMGLKHEQKNSIDVENKVKSGATENSEGENNRANDDHEDVEKENISAL